MILPDKIEVQVVDKSGQSNPLSNVVFGLKIFTTDGVWHNYSVFKTNAEGYIALTRQQIIDNTELKYNKDGESGEPTSFELYVWNGPLITTLIKSTKHLLELSGDKEFVKEDLRKHGVAETKIPAAIRATDKKRMDDMAFFEEIKDATNDSVQIYTEKIKDVWLDILPKRYQFVIERNDRK